MVFYLKCKITTSRRNDCFIAMPQFFHRDVAKITPLRSKEIRTQQVGKIYIQHILNTMAKTRKKFINPFIFIPL